MEVLGSFLQFRECTLHPLDCNPNGCADMSHLPRCAQEQQATRHSHEVTSIRLARTIYIRCIYGISGREIIKYTVVYGVYTRFWPTLHMYPVSPC